MECRYSCTTPVISTKLSMLIKLYNFSHTKISCKNILLQSFKLKIYAVIQKNINLKDDDDDKCNYFQKCFLRTTYYLKKIFTKTLKYYEKISIYL